MAGTATGPLKVVLCLQAVHADASRNMLGATADESLTGTVICCSFGQFDWALQKTEKKHYNIVLRPIAIVACSLHCIVAPMLHRAVTASLSQSVFQLTFFLRSDLQC